MTYRDILISPPHASYLYETLFDGGPDWPDWDAPTPARHFRKGGPVDQRPTLSEERPKRVEHPLIWGGSLNPHFGHLIAEYIPRIGFAVAAMPKAPVLFQTFPGWTLDQFPAHLWEVLAYYGLDRDRVRLVDQPLLARELHVWPQAEHLSQLRRPHAAWLAHLSGLAQKAGLTPQPTPLLYVTRQGMIAAGSGAHAGENYLIHALQRAGVAILDPAKSSLSDQLSAYLGAKHIVFAEGSALHGRQMLGRLDQGITILNRGPGARLARTVLRPRVAALDYVEATRQRLEMLRPGGVVITQKGLSLMDSEKVLTRFAELGCDLRPDWDANAFAMAERHDLCEWLARLSPDGLDPTGRPLDLQATRARLVPQLLQAGYAELLEKEWSA